MISGHSEAVGRNPAAASSIVIKIGSAVLADAHSLDLEVIRSLAGQIAAVRSLLPGRRIVIVSSGAVAAGRAAMDNPSISPKSQAAKQALAAIGQGRLMHAWNEAFMPFGIITAQALLTRDDFSHRERFQHAANTFSQMLAWDVLPIVNENDTVSVHELKFGDNDTLASLLVNLVKADLFINLTSAPGVLAANPETEPGAHVLERIENIASLDIEALCGKKTALGSGGMYSKLLAARRVAQLGVPTLILPGRKKDVLIDAFEGRSSDGTWVEAAQKPIPRRKFWMAYQSAPKGIVEIDSGAARALLNDGRSLLPGGITAVSGEFEKGDLLQIRHDGHSLGVGFTNYSAEELGRIHGLKRHEIAAILGNASYPDAIHRDNLLLDAAV